MVLTNPIIIAINPVAGKQGKQKGCKRHVHITALMKKQEKTESVF